MHSVTFLGKTGAGKTSTINKVFALDWKTDDTVATTKLVYSVVFPPRSYSKRQKTLLTVFDTPGIAESETADIYYSDLYKYVLSLSKCVVWVFQADTRVFKPDQLAIKAYSEYFSSECRFIILLNQVDQLNPQDWNNLKNQPSQTQREHLKEKIVDIRDKFTKVLPVPLFSVIPFSAKRSYGIDELRNAIIY